MNTDKKYFIIDTHAHYNHKRYDGNKDLLLKSMKKDIGAIINVGTNTKSIKETLKLIDKYDYLYGIIGYFPSDTPELFNEDTMKFLEESIRHNKIVGVGEIGLDYHWNKPSKDIQEKFLRYQLELAIANNLPVSIHSRDAEADTLKILKEYDFCGVIHCYSYGLESAKEYVKKGLYLGIGGTSTYASNTQGRDVIKQTPLTQLVLETDAPYLTPVPFRWKINDSRYLTHVARVIADIKGVSVEEVINITTKNACDLFGLDLDKFEKK